MVKLFVSDLDGTLLSDNHVISDKNIKAIKEVLNRGHVFMVATGRSWKSVQPLFEPLQIQCPCILLNGALYIDEKGKIQKEIFLENTMIKKILEKLEELDLVYHLYTTKGVAHKDLERAMREYRERLAIHYHRTEEEIEEIVSKSNFFQSDMSIEDITSFLSTVPSVYKVEIFSNDEEKIKELRSYLKKHAHIQVVGSTNYHLEITHGDAQKGNMLAWALASMGLSKEEVAAFGDNENDISMLKSCVYSYAMGNANEKIKQCANYVALSNNESGVGKAILELLEKEE
ncbi:MAG: Cof-type HAD-IIB family hydrolase [Erysipelotrichaceae bacterium]|nr:Cof-type HAD-IIB family hydrolase [Erysipelotrichaceae bacterium]